MNLAELLAQPFPERSTENPKQSAVWTTVNQAEWFILNGNRAYIGRRLEEAKRHLVTLEEFRSITPTSRGKDLTRMRPNSQVEKDVHELNLIIQSRTRPVWEICKVYPGNAKNRSVQNPGFAMIEQISLRSLIESHQWGGISQGGNDTIKLVVPFCDYIMWLDEIRYPIYKI